MTDHSLDSITAQLKSAKTPSRPPLHLWNPDLSGDIDIRILANGDWLHEGNPIKRPALVSLFASILRRESDGEYYLVTPVEKWRLQVDLFPLMVTDFSIDRPGQGSSRQQLTVTLNSGVDQLIDSDHPLLPSGLPQAAEIPLAQLDYGLSALFHRSAWYRLVDHCEEVDKRFGIYSCGCFYALSNAPTGVD